MKVTAFDVSTTLTLLENGLNRGKIPFSGERNGQKLPLPLRRTFSFFFFSTSRYEFTVL